MRVRAESAVHNSGANDGNAVGCTRRPTHASSLRHPRVRDLVEAAFGSRRRDRLTRVVAAAIVDRRCLVVLEVGVQLLATSGEPVDSEA